MKKKYLIILGLVSLILIGCNNRNEKESIGERILNSIYSSPIPLENQWLNAARNGDIVFLQQMLNNGWNINFQTYDTQTALVGAINGSQYETVKFLLENGADPDIHYKHVMSNMLSAGCQSDIRIIEILADYGLNPQDAMLGSCRYGFYNNVVFLLSNYILDLEQSTLVSFVGAAVCHNRFNILQLLLENGASYNQYAYDVAILYGFLECAELLELYNTENL